MTETSKIYLAGPDIFSFEADKILEEMRQVCASYGLHGITPLDGEPLPESLSRQEKASIIFQRNLSLINQSVGIIANISPFRGIAMDPGTAFEIGYATAKGIPIAAWSEDDREYLIRVSGAYGGNLRKGDDQTWRDPSGIEVEDFGLTDNLMVTVPAGDIAHSFEEAVRRIAEKIDRK